jgi:hypothetical protein
MCAVSSALEQASTYIGRISQASFTRFPTADPAAADNASETPSKKKRTEASLPTAAAGTFSSQDVARSLAHVSASLEVVSGHIVKAKALALEEDRSLLSVFSAQEALGECCYSTCSCFWL